MSTVQLGALYPNACAKHLDHTVFEKETRTFLIVWEKKTGEHPLPEPIWAYDEKRLTKYVMSWPLQALMLTWDKTSSTLTLIRNASAFCPLYFLQKNNAIHFAWDPTNLYRHLSGPHILDKAQCEAFLNLRWNYGPDTLFHDIKMVPERACIIFSEHSYQILPPDNIAEIEPSPLLKNAQPVQSFLSLVEEAITWWPRVHNHTAVELSSGLDTTLIALMLARRQGDGLTTAGYLPLDPDFELIKCRRDETISKLSSKDICTHIQDCFDDAFHLSPGELYWPYQVPTSFEKGITAQKLKLLGIDLIFSGIGGDELCALTEKEKGCAKGPFKSADDDRRYISTSITHPDLDKEKRANLPSWPNGFVPQSAHDVANSIAPIYQRAGIWYAHPLSAPHIQTFAHFLPKEWRQGRRLSRDTLRYLGMSKTFLTQSPVESLSLSIDTALADTSKFNSLFQNSILLDFKLIDQEKLKSCHDNVKKAPGKHRGAVNLLLAYALEMGLKSLYSDIPA